MTCLKIKPVTFQPHAKFSILYAPSLNAPNLRHFMQSCTLYVHFRRKNYNMQLIYRRTGFG